MHDGCEMLWFTLTKVPSLCSLLKTFFPSWQNKTVGLRIHTHTQTDTQSGHGQLWPIDTASRHLTAAPFIMGCASRCHPPRRHYSIEAIYSWPCSLCHTHTHAHTLRCHRGWMDAALALMDTAALGECTWCGRLFTLTMARCTAGSWPHWFQLLELWW